MLTNYLQLLTAGTVGGMVLVLAIVGVVGIVIGSIKIKGVSLGLTGALFAGILLAHFCWNEHQATWLINALGEKSYHEGTVFREKVLDFLRDGGLVLFVYAVGMQAGPTFLASFRANGLIWNGAAISVVVLGFSIAVCAHKIGGMPAEATVGFYSGAVTNTPGLSAAQSAMRDVIKNAPPAAPADPAAPPAPPKADPLKVTTSGYAVAYPMGILGVIISMLAVRFLFRVKPLEESAALAQEARNRRPKPANLNLRVTNPGLKGKTIGAVVTALGNDVVVSRWQRNDEATVARDEQVLELGDLLHAVGAKKDLDELTLMVGEVIDTDLRQATGVLQMKHMVVSHERVTGRSVTEQAFSSTFDVIITRIARGGIEFVALNNIDLLIGDVLTVVGPEAALKRFSTHIGNNEKELDKPRLESLLFGITLGALLGALAIPLPGVPAPVKFGMAGGPLLVAILLSSLGKIGPLNFYMNHGMLHFMKEFGIGLFLAFIGLQKSEGLGVVVYDSATLVRLGGCPAYAQVNQYTIADPTQVCADPSDPAIGPPSSQYKCTQDVMTSPTMCVRGLRGEGGGPMAARSCTATMRSAPRPRPPRACG